MLTYRRRLWLLLPRAPTTVSHTTTTPTALSSATRVVHTSESHPGHDSHHHVHADADADLSPAVHDTEETIPYQRHDYYLIPAKHTVGRRIAVRSYLDRNRTELSDRTYKPQKAWFPAYDRHPARLTRDHERRSYTFYHLETRLIWTAFDKPECIGMLLHDETIRGSDAMYTREMLASALHYTRECRYWRCIGITAPFFNTNTLRAHCWADGGLQVGTLVMSQAMRHALMDLERAVRRKELGLAPNYLWDRWGPSGFIDGARSDFLPRFAHNRYMDPDGVDVTELDVLPFNTHEQIRQRYGEFIEPDTSPFEGVFGSVGHGSLTLEDVPNEEVVAFYHACQRTSSSPSSSLATLASSSMSSSVSVSVSSSSAASTAVSVLGESTLSPMDLRALFFLCADAELFDRIRARRTVTSSTTTHTSFPSSSSSSADDDTSANSVAAAAATAGNTSPSLSSAVDGCGAETPVWDEVMAALQPTMDACNAQIDAARMLQNTRHDVARVRAYFEEKCGFHDFMNTPDKTITAAVLCYLEELRRICEETTWGAALVRCVTDVERFRVMGQQSFAVYRLIEDVIWEKKRRLWARRFAGPANEESTLDYLLENFGRRTEQRRGTGTTGYEFDREQEPIGRQVQRRVLDADKSQKLADIRRNRGRLWAKNKQNAVFDSLHKKQMQNITYGVR